MKKKFNYVGTPRLPSLSVDESTGKRYYVTPEGNKYPSVTTVFSFFKAQAIQEWRNRVGETEANAISNRAATRGTKFHTLMERYLANEEAIFDADTMPDMRMAFNDCLPVMSRVDEIRYIESQLYSDELRLAGRTDCIAEFDGKLSIIDFKTSRKLKKEEWITDYFLQGCAYAMMYKERLGEPVTQTVIIISVDGEPEPQVFVKDNAMYLAPLLDKVKAYHEAHT